MSSRKRSRSNSRRKIRPKVVMRMQQSLLFRKTEEYHEKELKQLFRKYYKPPAKSDEVNKKWALTLEESTFNKLQLHLSWSMGISTFAWDRQNVGEQTIIQIRKLE